VTDAERRLLKVLVAMCEQYMSQGDSIDHLSMSAGENAVELLVQYGLLKPGPRGGTWTDAGLVLLNSN
jgi:hypothetical protein